jgi:tetratricopeptide (TPR) repeat protein
VLKDAEVIFERGIYPESTYIFKHALTQEVVYDSILTPKKKRLHEKIGNAIEELYKNNLHEHYGILAEHFISSENYEKGAEYCRLKGKKAEKAGSLNDAIEYGKKQVACLEKLPQTITIEKNLIDTRTKLALYYAQLAQYHELKAVVDPIVDLATEKNYKRRVAQIYVCMGEYEGFVEEHFTKAFGYLERALKIGEDLNDTPTLVLSNGVMGYYLSQNGDFAKSLLYFEKALAINAAGNVLWGISAISAWIAWVVYSLMKVVIYIQRHMHMLLMAGLIIVKDI